METSGRSEPDNVIELGRRRRSPAASGRAHLLVRPAGARRSSAADWARFRDSMAEIFEAFGMDLETPGTRDTPDRFLRALFEATAGYDGEPKLATRFPAEHGGRIEARARPDHRGADRVPLASASTMRCRSSAPRTSGTSRAGGSSASRS